MFDSTSPTISAIVSPTVTITSTRHTTPRAAPPSTRSIRNFWGTYGSPVRNFRETYGNSVRNLQDSYEKTARNLWYWTNPSSKRSWIFSQISCAMELVWIAWNSRNAQRTVHRRVAWMHLDHQHRKCQAPPESGKHHSIPLCRVFLPQVAKIQGETWATSAFHGDIARSSTSRATCSHTLLGLRRSPIPGCRLSEDLQTMKVSIWSDMKSNDVAWSRTNRPGRNRSREAVASAIKANPACRSVHWTSKAFLTDKALATSRRKAVRGSWTHKRCSEYQKGCAVCA